MPATILYRPATRTVKYDSNPPILSNRQIQMRYDFVPAKAIGIWVTLPGGSKFRKATARLRYTRWLELGSAQYKEATLNGGTTKMVVTDTAGGYYPDVLMSANGPALQSSIGTLSKFSGTTNMPTEMKNEASTKALLELADNKANVGENLATFRQTLQLVRAPAGELYSALKLIREDQGVRRLLRRSYNEIKNSKSIPKAVSRRYLEYVYGVKPLMSDVHGVMSMLKEAGLKTMLLSGEGHSEQQCEVATNKVVASGTSTELTSCTERAHVRTKIWGRIDPNCPGLRSLNQLGLINPVSLAWELVPLSFVFDWFVPVGSVLQALTAPAGLIFVDGTVSCRNSLAGNYNHWWDYADATATVNNPASGTILYEGYNRTTLNGWPLPGVWANSNPFSGDRSLKALALAIVNLRIR